MVRSRHSRVWVVAAMAFLGLQATGCSERTAKVSGVVKLDDSPMKITEGQRGIVVFRPVAGGATCTSLINGDGTYSVATGASAGVTPGDYMVSVRVIELVPGDEEGQGASGQPITPALYADPLTSGLMFKVGSGVNNVAIELDSQAGPAVLPPPVVEGEVDADGPEENSKEGEAEGQADEDADQAVDAPQDQETEAASTEGEPNQPATAGDK